MKAASPPAFWASAIICRPRVVLPLDSGPKISTMRPRGTPPTPRARSRARAPVEIEATFWGYSSPMRMIEPFPNCRSICETAASMALLLSNASSKKRLCIGWLINIGIYCNGLYCRRYSLPRAYLSREPQVAVFRVKSRVRTSPLSPSFPRSWPFTTTPTAPALPVFMLISRCARKVWEKPGSAICS